MTKLHHAVHFAGSGPKPRNVADAEFYTRQAVHSLRQAKAFLVRSEGMEAGSTGKARGHVGLALLELERKSGLGADEEE